MTLCGNPALGFGPKAVDGLCGVRIDDGAFALPQRSRLRHAQRAGANRESGSRTGNLRKLERIV